MSTQILRPVASVTVTDENDEDLEVVADNARVVVDSGAVPYGSATVQVPLIAPETIEVIDPREDVRATVAIGEEGDTPRVFDLAVRSRRVDHKAKRIEMQLATDEALLQDYAPLTRDVGAFDYQDSIRDVVDYVLGKAIPGAALEAGTADASVRVYTEAVNLIRDPGTAASVIGAGGYAVTNCTLDQNDPSWSISSDGDSFNLYYPSAADCFLEFDYGSAFAFGVQPGKTYVFSATGNVKNYPISGTGPSETDAATGTTMPRQRALVVYAYNGSSYKHWHSEQVTNTINTPTRVSVEFTVPLDSTQCVIRAYHGGTGGEIRWDGFRLSEKDDRPGVDNTEYFDGDTTDTDEYLYAWDNVADNSISTRTPMIDRQPESLIWDAGVSAWDFLQPLTAVAGLRLYCDETRAWRLIDPAEFTSPGRVTLSPLNSTEGVDEISRENADIYCTGVVVKYSWTDPTGTAKTATDTAGTAGRVFIVELNRPYPGPGVAAAILARRQGQGRTQDVTALAVWAAQPGQEASISLPGTVEQIGRVASVEWELPAGLMRVGTTGLVDVPPEAWLALDPGESWLDSPIGESWTDEVI